MATQALHFKIDGDGFTDLVRQIYHFENNPDKAMQILANVKELPVEDAYAVLQGDARFVSVDDGKRIKLVPGVDTEFKETLVEHAKYKETVVKREKAELEILVAGGDIYNRARDYGSSEDAAVMHMQNFVDKMHEDNVIDVATIKKSAEQKVSFIRLKKQPIEIENTWFKDEDRDIRAMEQGLAARKAIVELAEFTKRENKHNLFLGKREIEGHLLCQPCPEYTEGSDHCYKEWFASCHKFKEFAGQYAVNVKPYAMRGRVYLEEKPWMDNIIKPDDVFEVVEIFRTLIRKSVLDEYINHIVDRLKSANQKVEHKTEIWYNIEEKEDLRRKLHHDILFEAGFEIAQLDYGSCAFRAAVESYVENRVKELGGF
jgi:hypothetical protein